LESALKASVSALNLKSARRIFYAHREMNKGTSVNCNLFLTTEDTERTEENKEISKAKRLLSSL